MQRTPPTAVQVEPCLTRVRPHSSCIHEAEQDPLRYLIRSPASQILRSLKKMSKAKRTKIGKEANKLKNLLQEMVVKRSEQIERKSSKDSKGSGIFDITIPGKKPSLGHLHPLTQAKKRTEEIKREV